MDNNGGGGGKQDALTPLDWTTTMSSTSSLFSTDAVARSHTRTFRQAVQAEMHRLQHQEGLSRAAAVETLLARLTSATGPPSSSPSLSSAKGKGFMTPEIQKVKECYDLTLEEARRALLVKAAVGQLRRRGWDASAALMELTARMAPLRVSSPPSPPPPAVSALGASSLLSVLPSSRSEGGGEEEGEGTVEGEKSVAGKEGITKERSAMTQTEAAGQGSAEKDQQPRQQQQQQQQQQKQATPNQARREAKATVVLLLFPRGKRGEGGYKGGRDERQHE
eukprot:evm.model.NODE_45347_length_14926_cov_28.295391.4